MGRSGDLRSDPFACVVPGIAQLLLVEVQPRLVIAKRSEPQAEGRDPGIRPGQSK